MEHTFAPTSGDEMKARLENAALRGYYTIPPKTEPGENDYAFDTDHTIRDNATLPDTIADPEGAARRAEIVEKPQLPEFVTEDYTPKYSSESKSWYLTPKTTVVDFLTAEIKEIYAFQKDRTEIELRAQELVDFFEGVINGVGQWTAMDFVRSTIRNSARSLANGVRTSVSAYNWGVRLAETDKDTDQADQLVASANAQVEDAVVMMLAATIAGEHVLGGEADLKLELVDWKRAAKDALGLEGARQAKRYADALNPQKVVERKTLSAKAALGALKGKLPKAA